MCAALAPVAQYLRMSTEHQRYSIPNQARAIAKFAEANNYQVVRTFSDPGRSGLTIKDRPGLRALLADVVSPNREYDRILVLDVSRWGRFIDLDESAHYEFICRAAGVPVIYCAEAFENDGSPAMILMKQIKRLMAAEYSMELSQKVHRAQCFHALIGHKQGGGTKYGFDRLLVDASGKAVAVLARGELKALNDQRVVFTHAAYEEQEIIREIFRLYTREKLSISAVARRLNEQGLCAKDGAHWTMSRVRRVLTNDLLVGIYVFNQTSKRLHGPLKRNPPTEWVRSKVLPPVLSKSVFELAGRRLSIRRHGASASEALEAVARLFKTEGYLSSKLINGCAYTPSTTLLAKHFGSMTEVYRKVGYTAPGRWRLPGTLRPATDTEILEALRHAYNQHGYLSEHVLRSDSSVPSTGVLVTRFGSLTKAYELAGLPFSVTELQRMGLERARNNKGGAPPSRSAGPRWPELPAHFSDEALLGRLQWLYSHYGQVTAELIRSDKLSPDPATYVRRFGSLAKAYEAAGVLGKLPGRPRGRSSGGRHVRGSQSDE